MALDYKEIILSYSYDNGEEIIVDERVIVAMEVKYGYEVVRAACQEIADLIILFAPGLDEQPDNSQANTEADEETFKKTMEFLHKYTTQFR